MAFWNRNNSTGGVVWRNKEGKITCPGNSCPQTCDDRCPVWLNTKGLEMLMAQRPEYAIEKFKKAVAIAPDFPDAHNNLGSAYGLCSMHKLAYDSFSKALELRPDYPTSLRGLIVAEKNLGMFGKALEHCSLYERVSGKSAKDLRDEINSLSSRQRTSGSNNQNWLLTAEKLLDIGRKEGYIKSQGFPQIPEIMVCAEPVSKKILQACLDNRKQYPTLNPAMAALAWAAFAGMGAVYHWDKDWDSLSKNGVYETLTRERGFDEMDEYVLDSIGIPFKGIEGKKLNKFIQQLTLECATLVFQNNGTIDYDTVIFGAKAMYSFGVVFEMNRLGMR